MPFKIFNVIGARPNIMKMAPLVEEMRRHDDLRSVLVHTGQHYDPAMSDVFLQQLQMGEPEYNLRVGPGTHHAQTAQIVKSFGELVQSDRPDMIVVAGDVNSTMACALVAAKEMIPISHVESGLRSFDRGMPEEVNRIVTDALADLLFTTEESASENLLREGADPDKIYFVGNTMIDTLARMLETARQSPIRRRLGLRSGGFVLLTLHRPSNVDDPSRLLETLGAVEQIAQWLPVLFPVHPRVASKLSGPKRESVHVWDGDGKVGDTGLWMMQPVSYIEFLSLMDSSAFVITDSGGVQEETTYLGVPCLTYRENTERPITTLKGTNHLVGADPRKLVAAAKKALGRERGSTFNPIPLWDGHAAERIVASIREFLGERTKGQSATNSM
jgi:UDP-N-acetylglucosamine 2-epimerase (non-hydrolysing)